MTSTQFWIRFWIHSNKFLDKVFAKALFLKSFLVCNFWKIWFWFLLTDPSVQHILICYQAFLWVQKDAEQNFDTYEDPIWAINHNLRTFLKSSKPFVLFISDMSLVGHIMDLFGKRFLPRGSLALLPCLTSIPLGQSVMQPFHLGAEGQSSPTLILRTLCH